jgi:hypothetical protein
MLDGLRFEIRPGYAWYNHFACQHQEKKCQRFVSDSGEAYTPAG